MKPPLRPTEERVLAELRAVAHRARRDRRPVPATSAEYLARCSVSPQDLADSLDGLWGKGLVYQDAGGLWCLR